MKKVFFFLLLVLLFVSCNKDNQIGINKSALSTNGDFQSMISELNSMGVYRNSDGILVFQDTTVFNNVLALLDSATNNIIQNDTTLTLEMVLYSMAEAYDFRSLYQVIETTTEQLERNDQLYEYNDPDNHYIVNDYMRAVLTPYCELIIGDLLYVFFDEFTIGIMDYDNRTRTLIHSMMNRNAAMDEYYTLCSENPKVFVVSTENISVNSDFLIVPDFSDNMSFTFSNLTSCEDYNNVTYSWNFGDGTYSSQKNPSHTYSSTGSKIVTLSASYNGITKTCSKTVEPGSSKAYIDFTTTHDNEGRYFFTINTQHNSSTESIAYYIIDFGDGEDSTITTSNSTVKIKHKYDSYNYNQNVSVRVTVFMTNGTQYYQEKFIKISHRDCKKNCSAISGKSPELPHYHLGGNKYVKTAIRAVNFGCIHHVHTKTVYLKKKPNNSYNRIKADNIYSGCEGRIYLYSENTPDDSCGVLRVRANGGSRKGKVKNHTENILNPFSVDHYSINARFSITDYSNNIINTTHSWGAIYK